MDLTELKTICDQVSLGPEHVFRADYYEGSTVMFVQHLYQRPEESDPTVIGWGRGRKWHISPHVTESEVVLTCLKAAITNAEHEVREAFHYQGRRIFNPHPDVAALGEVAHRHEFRGDFT